MNKLTGLLTLTSLEMLLGPPFEARFLLGAVDAALFQDFVLRRHDFPIIAVPEVSRVR
jgi:hypothetical protein